MDIKADRERERRKDGKKSSRREEKKDGGRKISVGAKQKNRTTQKPLLYKQDSRHVHMHLFAVNFQSKCSKQPCPKHPSLDRLSAAPETVTQKCFEQS